jgi:plastocyanin
MKITHFLLIAASVFAFGDARATSPSDAIIAISNFTFRPGDLHVKVGTRVTFKNEDDIPHRVAANDGSFVSRALDSDDEASFTFSKLGIFAYFCTLHPRMQGKIIVTP